jgi:hypothetical protein
LRVQQRIRAAESRGASTEENEMPEMPSTIPFLPYTVTTSPYVAYVHNSFAKLFLVIFIHFVLSEVVTEDNEATLFDVILFHIWNNNVWRLDSSNCKCQLHLSVNLLLLVPSKRLLYSFVFPASLFFARKKSFSSLREVMSYIFLK